MTPSAFLSKVETRALTVGILGLGYVGLPLARATAAAGFRVIGFDILPERIAQLDRHESPIQSLGPDDVARLYDQGFHATTDVARAAECDVLLICVPTPLSQHREPDLSFVRATMDSLGPHLRAGQMLSLESTTWPGTTEEVLAPYIAQAGFTLGEDFYLAYSPEREDPGNPTYHAQIIPKVVSGQTAACQTAALAFFGAVFDTVVPISSPRAAEMVKLLENIHRAVNIGLVNEMKIVAERMGLDIFEIIDVAKTKPFGFTAYYPGPGIGGHCIPIDPFYLTWKAREYGVHTRFIELAGEINAAMPDYVVGRLVRALNATGKSLKGARILVLGIAYKRDVDDTRESPAILVMEHLRELGADISYADPHVPVFPKMRNHRFDLSAMPVSASTLAASDAVLLLTDHSAFDYDLIADHAPLIVDTRGRFRDHPRAVRA